MDVGQLYSAFLGASGVAFLSISIDETLDFQDAQVSSDTFPWEHWRLVRAAVRVDGQRWDEREGRARLV